MLNLRLKKKIVFILLFSFIFDLASCKFIYAQSEGEITKVSIQVSLFTREVAVTSFRFFVYEVEECPHVIVGYKVNSSLAGYTYPGFWEEVENGWLFTYDDVVPLTKVTGEFPNDAYRFQIYLFTNLTTAFENVISRDVVSAISSNYIRIATGTEITGKDVMVDAILHIENLTRAYRIDVLICHTEGFEEAITPFVSYIPNGIFLLGLLLTLLLIKNWIEDLKERFPSNFFISSTVSVLIFLPMYWFSIRQFQTPLSYSLFDTTLFNLTCFYLIILGIAIVLRLGDRRLRTWIKNFIKNTREEDHGSIHVTDDSTERLDRAFDLILLLIGIICATIFQYVSVLGDIVFITFAMRFLFIPLIPLVLLWLFKFISDNPRLRIFVRIFAWFFGIFSLFSNLWFFFAISFLAQLATSVYLIVVIAIILYIFAFLLHGRVYRAYGYERRDILPITILAYLTSFILTIITVYLAYLPTL